MIAAPLVAGILAAAVAAAPSDAAARRAWPHWERYVATFLSPDGRIIEHTANDRTTSEGQAYALFFALAAGDAPVFERVLRWIKDNLAQGDLGSHLPAWNWGRRQDGSWGVLDGNSAADADLWMAYALVEAGRLWSEPRYAALGQRLLVQIATREVATLPGLGPMLLPAPQGFVIDGGRGWRLNPSYLPPQVLRRLGAVQAEGPWRAVLDSAVRMLRATAPRGVVADWVAYGGRGWQPDPYHGSGGSYDAIRCYLWVGMLAPDDGTRGELAPATDGMLRILAERHALPEKIDVRTLRGEGQAPVGFYAALLPGAGADVARQLEARVDASLRDGLYGSPPKYYDQNLVLFARGFRERRFRFAADGRLETAWEGRWDAAAR